MTDINDPRYEFAPGMFNFSQWSRENIDKGEPCFKIGERVMFTQPLYIHRIYEDCDGTPLFAVGMENPANLTEEEKKRDWTILRNYSANSFTRIGVSK